MIQLSAVLSTETTGAVTASLQLTDETVITLDVILKSGKHDNSRVTLQHSPDGNNWFDDSQSTNGTGSITVHLATAYVRACVCRGEETLAAANIFITAK